MISGVILLKNKDDNINLVLSNSILLIPLVYTIIESLNKLPSVRLLTIIFGLVLVGTLLVSNFLVMISNQFNKDELKKKLLLSAYLLSSSMYLLLFIFIMVIMICL